MRPWNRARSVALVGGAMALCASSLGLAAVVVADIGSPPRQYYPVQTIRVHLQVDDSAVSVIPQGAPQTAVGIDVTAEVTKVASLPLRFAGRSGWKPYAPSHNPPNPEVLREAGPERGAIISISATELARHGSSASVRLLCFPPENTARFKDAASPVMQVEAMPESMVSRILPVVAADVINQCGDVWLADAVRAGGLPPPALGFFQTTKRSAIAVWLLLVAAVGLASIVASRTGAIKEAAIDDSAPGRGRSGSQT